MEQHGPSEPGAEPAPELITVDQLAAMMGLNHKTVYAMIQDDQIPGVRRVRSRTIRIHRDTVLRWLATGQKGDSRPRREP
jgi:excisionase family DNA binding protein